MNNVIITSEIDKDYFIINSGAFYVTYLKDLIKKKNNDIADELSSINKIIHNQEDFIFVKKESKLGNIINNLLEEKEMTSNLNYIANLIDTVKVNYIYKFTPEELIKGTYNYNITATINIVDQVTGELYYTKDYNLVDSIEEHILKSKLEINNTIDIDYDYFKDIAYKTISYYGTNAKANLNVSFNINKD